MTDEERAKYVDTSDAVTYRYGPERPEEYHDYVMLRTPKFLSNYSRKILRDMVWVASRYTGRKLHLLKLHRGERCPVCTNAATGERILSNCPSCHGTGYVDTWEYMGIYYALVDFQPTYSLAGPAGNTNNPGNAKDSFNVLGAPLIKDQDLLLVDETDELFKVYDVQPFLVAMKGEVIMQQCQAARVDYGGSEYKAIDKIPPDARFRYQQSKAERFEEEKQGFESERWLGYEESQNR